MQELILPSEIPWESLHAKDFEECLYWLFDAMGARGLEWGVGGTGDGAADGGSQLMANILKVCKK